MSDDLINFVERLKSRELADRLDKLDREDVCRANRGLDLILRGKSLPLVGLEPTTR